MKRGMKLLTAAMILTGAVFACSRAAAAESTFFSGGISVNPNIVIFRELEFARQFSWFYAFQFGKKIHLNQSPYYGDAWNFYLSLGMRYYFAPKDLSGYFINVNAEAGILDVPYYIAAAGFTTTNAYSFDPAFGYKIGLGYRWVLGRSAVVDTSLLYGLEVTAMYNGLFIAALTGDLRYCHFLQFGIDFVIGFPAYLPAQAVKPDMTLPTAKLTNLSPANTGLTNSAALQSTNQPGTGPTDTSPQK
ncbi:MAG: hypothetical protein A2Y33_16305 [Spirochaetes bacterium GWF1_51_8]|nr:MAG: hypothetical protein A2Y33_16305 [Spirochaetes bacterium GWF1_51_8]